MLVRHNRPQSLLTARPGQTIGSYGKGTSAVPLTGIRPARLRSCSRCWVRAVIGCQDSIPKLRGLLGGDGGQSLDEVPALAPADVPGVGSKLGPPNVRVNDEWWGCHSLVAAQKTSHSSSLKSSISKDSWTFSASLASAFSRLRLTYVPSIVRYFWTTWYRLVRILRARSSAGLRPAGALRGRAPSHRPSSAVPGAEHDQRYIRPPVRFHAHRGGQAAVALREPCSPLGWPAVTDALPRPDAIVAGMRLGTKWFHRYRRSVDGLHRDCLANLQDLLMSDERLEVSVPVSTGHRVRFYGYAGVTSQRFLLTLMDHPRRRRPFEVIDGVFTAPRVAVGVRRTWRLDGRVYGYLALRVPERNLDLQHWGEPLRPLAESLAGPPRGSDQDRPRGHG